MLRRGGLQQPASCVASSRLLTARTSILPIEAGIKTAQVTASSSLPECKLHSSAGARPLGRKYPGPGVKFELTATRGKLPSSALPCVSQLLPFEPATWYCRAQTTASGLPLQPLVHSTAQQDRPPPPASLHQGMHRGCSPSGPGQEGRGPMHRHDPAFNRPPRSNRCSVPLPILPSALYGAFMNFQCIPAGRWRP